jgi:predicted  nucleic acid-binding Zn-ribbon protein
MGMMWLGNIPGDLSRQFHELTATREKTYSLEQAVRDLEHQVARLALLNQALWELLRERVGLSDADLKKKTGEVDLRDGVPDGALTHGPLQCPTCGRISNSKHWKCLYCGQEFEKPIMG